MVEVSDLLEEAAPEPGAPVDPQAVWAAGRRRRRRRQAAVTVVTVAVVGVIGLGAGRWLTSGPSVGPIEPVDELPASPPADGVARFDGPVVTLEGWRRTEAFGVAISVPPGWRVVDLRGTGTAPCQRRPQTPTLYLSRQRAAPGSCPDRDPLGIPWAVLSDHVPEHPPTPVEQLAFDGIQVSVVASGLQAYEPVARISEHSIPALGVSVTTHWRGSQGWDEQVRLVSSVRSTGEEGCLPPACTAPTSTPTPVGRRLRIDRVDPAELTVAFTVVNHTDTGVAHSDDQHVERWDGTQWKRYRLTSGVQLYLDHTGPHSASAARFPARLPARPGYYRVVQPLQDSAGAGQLDHPAYSSPLLIRSQR